MRENRVERALAAGERSLGTMIFEFPTTGIGRIVAGRHGHHDGQHYREHGGGQSDHDRGEHEGLRQRIRIDGCPCNDYRRPADGEAPHRDDEEIDCVGEEHEPDYNRE